MDRIAVRKTGRPRPLLKQRLAAHAFVAALGVLAWTGAHRLAYVLDGRSSHHEEHGVHSYLPVLRLAAVVVAAVALAAFAASVWRSRARGTHPPQLRQPVRLLPLWSGGAAVAFILVELAEASFTQAPSTTMLLTGAVLQMALVAFSLLVSRRVLPAVARLVGRARACRRRSAPVVLSWSPRPALRRHGALFSAATASRAPPTA